MSSFRFYGIPRAGEALHSIISSCVIRQPQPSLSILAHNSSHCQHHRDCCTNRVVAAVAKEAANHHHQQQQLRSSNLVALEYADLNLQMPEELGSARIRQHVNPFKASLSISVQVPEWNQIFKDSTLPLMVDIGSGSGRFLMWLAKRNVDSRNYLGLEIRQKLVKRAEFWVKGLALHNIHFMFTNATVSFQQLVSTYPGSLTLVSILCPDPHFKKRHHKRRVVQKPLVNSIVNNLVPGGQVFVESDVAEVALDIRNQFDAESGVLQHTSDLCDDEGWLLSNPLGIRTEREIHAEFEGAKIYRRLYHKKI